MWKLEVKEDIGIYYLDDSGNSVEAVEEGTGTATLSEGPDPEELLKDFCLKFIVPSAQMGVGTKRFINECRDKGAWKEMLDPYFRNDGDLFWGARAMRIYHPDTDETYLSVRWDW